MKIRLLALLAALLSGDRILFSAPAVDRYTPDQLLSYRAADGRAAPITSPIDWPKRREQIIAAMQHVMGPLPDRSKLPTLDVKVLGEVRGNGFVRQSIQYTSEIDPKTGKGERVPAFLFIPTDINPGEKRPAILALHPTSKLGKAEITGEGKANRQYGLELAQRGYVVICPDYPSFGDYAKDFAASPHPSGTMQGIVNHMRAVDLLCERPEVDANRIGVIGHSLGGHNSLFVAVFDQRIKAVVTSCGWNVFQDYYKGNLAGWASDRYMPRIRTEYGLDPAKMPFDFHEVLAAIAPRQVLSISPTGDANFAVEGVRKGIAAAKPVFALLGVPDALQVEYPDCQHDFPPEMRDRAYKFLDKVLQHASGKPKSQISNLKSEIPAKADAPATPASAPKKPATRDLAAELQRVPAKTPAEAEKCIQTLPGYHAKLVASEPLVFSPVAIDFDENGRAFVCEMIDYPFVAPEPMGKIAILEDTDGNGVYDKRTVLADKIPWPTAVLCYDGGCFVGSAPDILYLKDTKGTGAADVRKVVFTGFGKNNVQGLLNCFRWGIDNRIHGATSSNGGKVRRADLPENDPKNIAIDLRGRDFSFDPRKLDLRPESGGGQHGMCFDDFGRKFVCSNSDHLQQIVYDDRYAAKSAVVPLPPARVSIAADGPQAEVFRISPVEAWRVIRTQMRVSGEVKGIVEGGGRPAGYFTGATGVTIYRGDACPELRGQAFIGDVGSNLVSRKKLVPTDGVLLRGERLDQGKEFLASTDIWFRPAQFANAPDGTLYVLDVCREVIEHPDSLPDVIKQHLDLTSGRDRGRIYRVIPDGYKQKPVPQLGKMTTAELVKLLEHKNAWHRETASRLLYERQDKEALRALHALAEGRGEGKVSAATRLHALYALRSIGDDAELGSSLAAMFSWRDDQPWHGIEPIVYVHALKLLESNPIHLANIGWLPRFVDKEVAANPAVRLQTALSFGQSGDQTIRDHVPDHVAAEFRVGAADEYHRAALMAAAQDQIGALFWKMVSDPIDREQLKRRDIQNTLRALGRAAASRRESDQLPQIVKAIDAILIDNGKAAAREAILGIMSGLPKSDPDAAKRVLTGRTASFMEDLFKEARQAAGDLSRPIAERVEAVRTLETGPLVETRELLSNCLAGREAQEVQLAAIASLDAHSEAEVGDVLTKAWPRLTPRVRAAAIDVLLSRPNRALAFLAAIDAGKIPATDLDATRLKRLQASKDAKVKALANAIAKRSTLSPRNDVIASYKKALDLKGDREKGKAIFTQTCATCHKLENIGTEIGPNLAAMQSRGAEAILVNVLDPNREVNGQYVEYVVDTKDGRTISGLLSSETSAAVTLLKPGGQKETVARNEIEKLRGTGQSLMPEGLERQIPDPQQMADLIAYLMTAK
jgi:putative membrane-bound dehydrogenase-like protein